MQTSDWYGSRTLVYSTTDVLYPLNNVFFILDDYCVGSNVYEVDWEYLWNYDGLFWTRQPVSTEDSLVKVFWSSAKEVYPYPVNQYYDARPAGNLDLSNVLFASAASGSASGIAAGTIASDKAMTLRMDGSGKHVGSAEYDASNGVIVADLDAYADGPVSLVVQGNDGTRDWYFSQRLYISLTGGTQVTAAQIKAATGASSVDLSQCRIWVECTDASERMTYAVPATAETIEVTTVDSVELTGMTPAATKDLPTSVACSPAGVFCAESGVTYTAGGSTVTGTAKWDTAYTAEVTLHANTLSSWRHAFADSVTVTIDGRELDATFSPDRNGNLTVTCELTTKKGRVFEIAGLQLPEGNTFASYYGFSGCAALPTEGTELGSVATFEYRGNSTVAQAEVERVTWALGDVGYDSAPGAVNTFRWTVPAGSLADYDVTGCDGYDPATGNVTGTVEIANRAATPVRIADSGASNYFAFLSPSTAVDVSALFDIDPNAGTASYKLTEATTEAASLAGSTLTVAQPGIYAVELTTAENGIYAAGYGSALVRVVEPFEYLGFGAATYGYSPVASQSFTFTNASDSYAMTSIKAASSYFKVSGLPANSSIAPGGTATLSVRPKDGLDAGTYSEVIVIHASSGGDFGFDSYISASFTVGKAGISPSVTIGDWTYGANPAKADVSGNAGNGAVSLFYKPQGAGDSDYAAGLPANAGSYTLKAVVAETENYLGAAATCGFEVSKADAAVGTAPSAKSGLAYTGLAQALVNAGTASGGSMEYSLDGAEWSSAIPTATKVGEYTVRYRVQGDANHHDAEGGSVSASITKAETSIGLSASASSLSGGGTVTLSVDTSGLPAGAAYRVACMDSEVAITAAGAHTYSVTLPNKTQRYAFRAYCDATENYGASQSDHVYVEVAYLEPPALPPALSFPVTGGSGGIQVGGQLVGSKALVPDIDQGSVEEVLKSGAQGALKLDLSGLGSPVTSAQLSKTTVGGLVKAGTQAGEGVESVTIAMDGMSIELDRQALASIEQQMGESVEVGLEEKGAGELTAEQQQALARYSEMVKCVEASIKSARSAIHSFDGGSVSISVAFQPAEGANPACYKVVYVAEDGSIEYHDAVLKDGTLSFSSSHLSTYAIVYIEPAEETLALAEALEALPQAEKLKAADAKAAVEAARAALERVAALGDDQRAIVDDALVANAQEVVAKGSALVAAADEKAAKKVKNKLFSVKAGKSKSIYFKTKLSSAGAKVTYKKTSGSKYITVSKSGKVTAKKGMKAGKTYTAKVKVTCGATTRTVKITVRAK